MPSSGVIVSERVAIGTSTAATPWLIDRKKGGGFRNTLALGEGRWIPQAGQGAALFAQRKSRANQPFAGPKPVIRMEAPSTLYVRLMSNT